jgi:predicted HicB family RNase H-like nuclease
MNEEIDSFASMFDGPPGERQREARAARKKAERRTQLTEKQRKRAGGNAVRTDQINFRCSPAFHELAAGMAKHLGCSIADVMEEALQMLASSKGYGGSA